MMDAEIYVCKTHSMVKIRKVKLLYCNCLNFHPTQLSRLYR